MMLMFAERLKQTQERMAREQTRYLAFLCLSPVANVEYAAKFMIAGGYNPILYPWEEDPSHPQEFGSQSYFKEWEADALKTAAYAAAHWLSREENFDPSYPQRIGA